jgi:RNA polymerase sigma-70 factor (ECF subfamily)
VSAKFDTTNWSLVLHARTTDPDRRRAALEELCQTYWYPLYGFARSRGSDEAADLTQAFFAHLIEKHALRSVEPANGRFRAFLLASFRNFLNDAWQRERTLKRGGHLFRIEFDPESLERRYQASVVVEDDPERLYEREWALTLLNRGLQRLKRACEADGKSREFELLSPHLTDASARDAYPELARALDISQDAVRVAVYRLRRRFAVALREEVAATVQQPEEVADELRQLLKALGSAGTTANRTAL